MAIEIVRTIVEDDRSFVLRRKDDHLELVFGNVVLLSSAALETERTFGRLATGAARVIVGGLGFGSTLRGVLDVASADAEVIVVEKLRTVIDVARAEASALFDGALDDPRVVVRHADVVDVLAEAAPSSLSAILLDVDNGPGWASYRTNARLYAPGALVRTRETLAHGGIVAVWSGYPADAFTRTLRQAGYAPRIVPLHERGVLRARAYVGTRA